MSKSMYRGNMPESGELVAESRGWILIRLGESGDWMNLKLVAKTVQPKGNFRLAWNGERLAMSLDAKKLNTHHPDIFDWVSQELGRK